MPRFTNTAGVVVNIPAELAERLGGYTPVEASAASEDPQGADPDLTAWLAAEESYRADVAAWLDAETAAANAQQVASQSTVTGRGRK